MTSKEIAHSLDVTQETVRNWINSGKLIPNANGQFSTSDVEKMNLNKYDGPQWVTSHEAGRLLGITRATVYSYTQSGLLKSERLRGRCFISTSSIREYLNSQQQKLAKTLLELSNMEQSYA